MKISNLTLFIPILQIIISIGCSGQTHYFVNGVSGNDAANGLSSSTAWKTIQKACDNATPGSTVLISDGVYYEQPDINVSGTPGNPIIFEGVTGEQVIIDGEGQGGSTMITIIDKSHIHLRNLTIRNLVRNFAVGILVESTETGHITDVSFEKLTVTNINWTNDPTILPGPGNNSNPFLFYGTGVTASNSISRIVVDSCEIFNNITGYSESLTLNGNLDGAVISNNRIHHNKNIGICIAGNYNACSNPSLDHAKNVHIFGNEVFYNISQAATSAGIYVDGGRKVLIERNSSFNNGVGIEIGCERDGLTDSCIVRDNIVYHNLDWGIGVGGYDPATTGQVLYTSVTNNTLYMNTVNNSGMGEFYMPKASHCSFVNNIIYTSNQNIFLTFDPIEPQEDNVFDYNCWYTPTNDPTAAIVNWRGETLHSFSSYMSTTSFDLHSFYGNPILRNLSLTIPDFRLEEGSPCMNSGNPLFELLPGETDYVGFPRIFNEIVDIGAFEYQSSSSIGERHEGVGLTIFPNPCTLLFFVKGLTMGAIICLFDSQGNLAKEFEFSSAGYSVSDLICGIYLVKLKINNKFYVAGKLLVTPEN